MKRKKIVAGNWKMNGSKDEAKSLIENILQFDGLNEDVVKIFFPSFPFLSKALELIKNKKNFFVGAQNCSHQAKGAYTGEVSASILSSVGCSYCLVGHSERRQYFNEDSNQLISKIKLLIENNIVPVFCFGESLTERKGNLHFKTVETQLKSVLENFKDLRSSQIILAYEPVWAIGTGVTATPEEAQEMHQFIRGTISDIFNPPFSKEVSILYGGSCNAQNAASLFSCPDIDGGLIGGASLVAEDFCKIINSF